jgi:Ca2+-binding EF-hand superfamily protein
MRTILSAACAAALAVAASAPGAAATERLRAAHAAADVNGDGHVNVDEYVAYFIGAFRRVDAQNKGYLTMADLENVDRARFRAADRDGDGRISLGEAIAERMIVFFEIASDDGTITIDDLLAFEASR